MRRRNDTVKYKAQVLTPTTREGEKKNTYTLGSITLTLTLLLHLRESQLTQTENHTELPRNTYVPGEEEEEEAQN